MDKNYKFQQKILNFRTEKTLFMSIKIVLAICIILSCSIFVAFYTQNTSQSNFLIAAVIIGIYMALNIGANDVANNVSPAVGSKALTMKSALIIAAIFEATGALTAGGDVVGTIKNDILDTSQIPNVNIFIWAMMSALLAAAIWLNLATIFGAPVSTTHAIIGGVMGAGISAVGIHAIHWYTVLKIATSWIILPVIGGIFSAIFLSFIKFRILYIEDRLYAARKWVPILVSLMVSIFSVYMLIKGVKQIWKPSTYFTIFFGIISFIITFFPIRRFILKASNHMEGTRKEIASLFRIPLAISAAILSFAHGSNDIANAIGPLSAIFSGINKGAIFTSAPIPIWLMLIGAFGISSGLILFGPSLIRTVGSKITKLDPIRAYTVALSSAVTVIFASSLGLPVSSTHIALGSIFGVGFLREALDHSRRKKGLLRDRLLKKSFIYKEKQVRKRLLVRRHYAMTIATAWIITVPAGTFLGSILYYIIYRIMIS